MQAILHTLSRIFHVILPSAREKDNMQSSPSPAFRQSLGGIVRGVGVPLLKELLEGAAGGMPPWVSGVSFEWSMSGHRSQSLFGCVMPGCC